MLKLIFPKSDYGKNNKDSAPHHTILLCKCYNSLSINYKFRNFYIDFVFRRNSELIYHQFHDNKIIEFWYESSPPWKQCELTIRCGLMMIGWMQKHIVCKSVDIMLYKNKVSLVVKDCLYVSRCSLLVFGQGWWTCKG